MVKIMSKVEAETGRFVPSDRLLSQEDCTVSKYRDPKNSQKPFFFKDLSIFYRRVPLANDSNTLLIDDSPLKSLLNDQYNVVFPPTFRDSDGQADDFLVCRLLPYLDRLRMSRLQVPDFVQRNPCHGCQLPSCTFIGIANDLVRDYDPLYRPPDVCPFVFPIG